MNIKGGILYLSVSACALAGTAFPLAAQAQAQREEVSALDDIVVTARKKEEGILQAPLSVSGFTASMLAERNITGQTDLAMQTPGFDYTAPGGLSTARPVIRGMSQSSRAGEETNVATFIDGVYVDGFSSSAVFMDALERVEILRGPQSAQYGRNSFAGAINYITKKPTLEFNAGASAVIGEDGQYGISGFVNAPVIADKVALRIDGGYEDTGGYYRDAVSGQHLAARKTYAVRGGLLVNFSEVVKAIAQVSYQTGKTNTFARNTVATNDPNLCCRSISSGSPAGFGTLFRGEMHTNPNEAFTYDPRAFAGSEDIFHANLNLTADWGNLRLTSITGYDKRTFDTLSDQDRTPGGTTFTFTSRGGPPSTRTVVMQTLSGTREEREAFSEELRLESHNDDSPINWAIGGYYSKLDVGQVRRQGGEILSNTTTGTAPPANTIAVITNGVIPIAEITDAKTEFLSAFGSIDIAITKSLTLSGEGRYTWETKTVNNSYLSAAPNGVGSGLEEVSFKYFTPRVILEFKPSRDLMIYASAAKGTKSGGINAGIAAVATSANPSILPSWASYKPETAWSYEVGLKFSALNNRVRGSIAAYYVDWTNQQVSNTIFVTSVSRTMVAIANAAKSRVQGLEFEGSAVIVDGLVANIGYSLNDGKYTDAIFSGYNVENSALYGFPGGDVSGKRIQNTSKHTVNLGLEYSLPAFSDFRFKARADYIYRSKQYDTPVNLAWTPAYNTINLNFALENDATRIAAFCNNVLNDRGASVGFNSRNINGEVVYQIQPREGRRCGVRLSKSIR